MLASAAMMSIRGVIGFLTFHLLFWLREDYGLAQFGIAAGASTLGSMVGNIVAPALRRALREEVMLTIALTVIAGAGIAAALTGGLGTAIVVAFVVNFARRHQSPGVRLDRAARCARCEPGPRLRPLSKPASSWRGCWRSAAGVLHAARPGRVPGRRPDRHVRGGELPDRFAGGAVGQAAADVAHRTRAPQRPGRRQWPSAAATPRSKAPRRPASDGSRVSAD